MTAAAHREPQAIRAVDGNARPPPPNPLPAVDRGGEKNALEFRGSRRNAADPQGQGAGAGSMVDWVRA